MASLAPSAALAASPPPAAIAQYVEQIPTASGPHPGHTPATVSKLPEKTIHEIQQHAGTDAGALKAIATSSDLGAPATPRPRHDEARSSVQRLADGNTPSALSAAAGTLGLGAGSTLLPILFGVPIATILVGLASRRRKPHGLP